MKSLVFLSLALITLSCRAEKPAPFAPSDRIVTLVQSYGGAGPHWTVWAVQPGKIVIYEQSGRSGVPDKLLGDIAISPDQEMKLKQSVIGIPSASKGRIWFSPDVSDGLSLYVHFTSDGSRRDDDVALENLWRPEFRDLCTSISSMVPPALKITFEDIITGTPDQDRLRVISRAMRDYRAQGTEPNQSPQPTAPSRRG